MCIMKGQRTGDGAPLPTEEEQEQLWPHNLNSMSQSRSGLTETPIHTKGIQLKEMGGKTKRTTSWLEVSLRG